MFKKENLIKLENQIKEDGFDAYLILTSDPHASEYCAAHFLDQRQYFCPFSGSAGQVLVLKDEAFLFTDGRYWIQAGKELEDSGVTLMRDGDKGVLSLSDFIKFKGIKNLATDTLLMSEQMYEALSNKGINVIDKSYAYMIENLAPLSKDKIFKLREGLNSLSYLEKIENIIKQVEEKGAEANLITTLDDIAWILNLRSNDIPCNPVFYSYLYLSKKYGNHLFVDLDKIDFATSNISIHKYEEISEFLKEHDEVKTLIDPSKVNAKLFNILKNKILGKNPSYLMKAIKGEVEANNTKRIQAIDGVALLKFGKYLEDNLHKNLSEYDYSEKLKEFRLENKECFELSFDTIAAVGPNAAQMHYEPTKEIHSVVSNKDIELLVDSGGQYYGGTTDTTRTFLIGKPTQEYIHDYTLTLKAVIAVSNTIFLQGSDGHTIDIRSREYFWKEGMDYKCGTGHGVGYILNVHEGPNGLRYRAMKDRDDQGAIVPGMITTIEPGVYKENKYGIRIENNLLCVKAFETNDGLFYKFETITYVPIETRSLDLSMMTSEEIEWLNNYHKNVYNTLYPLIKDDAGLVNYLKEKTKAIGKKNKTL